MQVKAVKNFYYKGKTIFAGDSARVDKRTGAGLIERGDAEAVEATPKKKKQSEA